MPVADAPAIDDLLVVCLCAAWCGVCREYRPRFDAIGAQARTQPDAQLQSARFVWIDVEDDADLVDPVEVENFPTLLIAVGDQPRFFGTVTPQPETLQRLLRAQRADAAALDDAGLRALVLRLRRHEPD